MIRLTMVGRTTHHSPKRRHSRIGAITLALFLCSALLPGAVAAGTVTVPEKQIISLTANAGERQLYTLDKGFILASRLKESQATEGDLLLEKLNDKGKQEWALALPQPGEEEVQYIQKLSQDIAVVLSTTGSKGKSLRMLRLDSKGKIKWEKALPLKQFYTMSATNDYGAIIIGVRGTGMGEGNLVALKMDASGSWAGSGTDASRWEATLGSSDNSQISHVQQVLDEDDYNDGYILAGAKDMGGTKQKDVLTIRLDSYGALKWIQTSGRSGNDEAFSVTPLRDYESKIVNGFAVTGYCERSGQRQMYLLHMDISGGLCRWPGYNRAVDGDAETFYGNGYDTVGVGVYPVPDGFYSNRTINNGSYDGDGGILLLGLQSQGSQKNLLVVRITEQGHVKWESQQNLPGDNLMIGESNQSNSENLNVAYSTTVPADLKQAIKVNTLKLFLEKIDQDDKTISRNEKNSQYSEMIEWESVTFKYEVTSTKKDRSQDIKNLLAQQTTPALVSPRSGWGDIDWPDNSYYLGNLLIGKADGQGTILFNNGVWYKGAWKNNMFNGYGYLRFPTGEYYQGEFKDNLAHGKGVIVWPTGVKYEGDFFNDFIQGQGKLSWPNGTFYQGGFTEGVADGMGMISWPNGERYQGQMIKGQATGQGSYYFPNGEWYKGEIKGLVFEGVGVYHWANGSYYVGEFKKDRLYGEGYFVWPNGVQQWGYWKDDHYVGTNKETFEKYNKTKSN